MSERAESGAPAVPIPRSVEDLIAMALAVERVAATRYDELAAEMAQNDNQELAELFSGLSAEERKHETYISEWLGPGASAQPAITFEWQSPEAIDADAKDEAGGVYLMTPYRALRLAVHNEERAFAFFSEIAAAVEDPKIRAKAEALAKEELDHVVRLRLERRRAWRAETRAASEVSAHRGSRALTSLDELLNRARVIEREAMLDYDALTDAASDHGDRTSATLFHRLADDQRGLLVEIGGNAAATNRLAEQVAHALRRVARVAPYDALRLALAEAEESFDFYAAVAEQSADQAMMERAQGLAERALERLREIRDRLVEVMPPSAGAGAS